jgi:hypothetical protein
LHSLHLPGRRAVPDAGAAGVSVAAEPTHSAVRCHRG